MGSNLLHVARSKKMKLRGYISKVGVVKSVANYSPFVGTPLPCGPHTSYLLGAIAGYSGVRKPTAVPTTLVGTAGIRKGAGISFANSLKSWNLCSVGKSSKKAATSMSSVGHRCYLLQNSDACGIQHCTEIFLPLPRLLIKSPKRPNFNAIVGYVQICKHA